MGAAVSLTGAGLVRCRVKPEGSQCLLGLAVGDKIAEALATVGACCGCFCSAAFLLLLPPAPPRRQLHHLHNTHMPTLRRELPRRVPKAVFHVEVERSKRKSTVPADAP